MTGSDEDAHPQVPKRGSAAPDRQLSKLQRRMLVWIFSNTADLQGYRKYGDRLMVTGCNGSVDAKRHIKMLSQKGAAWSAKRFYGDAPTKTQTVSLSKALHRLETRGLVVLFDASGGTGNKSRTTHVKLTRAGEEAAKALLMSKGLSERELVKQTPEYARRRELWNLRRIWKQSRVDYRYAMHIFEAAAMRLTALGVTHVADRIPYADGYDEDHHRYMKELENEIYELEDRLGEPHKSLSIPYGWKSDGGFYRDALEELPELSEAESLVPF